MNRVSDYVYRRDMAGRMPSFGIPLTIQLAAHLEGHNLRPMAEPILETLRQGADMSAHLSPMSRVKDAFRKATRSGDWSRYVNLMDLLRNKWGIFHFHADSDRILVFSYICLLTRRAFIIDIRAHDNNWKVEKRLVEIVVENWPHSGIVREIGEGRAPLTEAELFTVRKRGINMAVGVNGKSYLPASHGLMMDGSGYDSFTAITPIVYTAKKIDPTTAEEGTVKSPHIMMFGVDPDDPRPSWLLGAEQAGRLIAQRRRDRTRYLAELGLGVVADAVRTTLMRGRR
jgi:hypothetical protein